MFKPSLLQMPYISCSRISFSQLYILDLEYICTIEKKTLQWKNVIVKKGLNIQWFHDLNNFVGFFFMLVVDTPPPKKK
jgi:hypothetical protein